MFYWPQTKTAESYLQNGEMCARMFGHTVYAFMSVRVQINRGN